MNVTPIENFITSLGQSLRDELCQIDDLSSLCLTIRIEGRVHSGELKCSFTLAQSEYGSEPSGGTYRAVVEEFKRRHRWKQANAPLAIAYDGGVAEQKEVLPNA